MKRGFLAFAIAFVVGVVLPPAEYRILWNHKFPNGADAGAALVFSLLATTFALSLAPAVVIGLIAGIRRAPSWSICGLPLGIIAYAVWTHVVRSYNLAINTMDYKGLIVRDYVLLFMALLYLACAYTGYCLAFRLASSK